MKRNIIHMGLLLIALAWAGCSPTEESQDPVSFQSLDGRYTFTVPTEGDPDWADYQAMRAHPRYRSSLDNNPMYQLPYDPEWRSTITGVRFASPVAQELRNSRDSLGELAERLLSAVGTNDRDQLNGMSIDRDEFEVICWPSFPQSRPYAKVPVLEAWNFHQGHCGGGIEQLLRLYGGRNLVLESVSHGETKDYGNFRLHHDVIVHAVDQTSGDKVEIANMESVIERHGRFKPYIYKD